MLLLLFKVFLKVKLNTSTYSYYIKCSYVHSPGIKESWKYKFSGRAAIKTNFIITKMEDKNVIWRQPDEPAIEVCLYYLLIILSIKLEIIESDRPSIIS